MIETASSPRSRPRTVRARSRGIASSRFARAAFASATLCLSFVYLDSLAATSSPEASSLALGSLGARLDSIALVAESNGFHGVVLVAKGGKEVLARGYGFANHATATRYSPTTVVPIGSNVKDFTKVAIFQLVESGKLALEDSIGRFFPEAPADKRGITVDQLIEHRSGLPLGFGPDSEPLVKAEFLKRVWASARVTPPGGEERYSNAGFSVLAAIVEKLAGESFDGYVARAILRPAGLTETGLLAPRFDPARLAHAYEELKDRGTMLDQPHDGDGHLWNLRGNGGYLATVHDQLRFFRAVAAGRLLKDRAHADRVYSLGGATVLAGSDLTSFFLFGSFPGESIEVVIATNHAEFPAPRLLEAFEPVFGMTGMRRTSNHVTEPVTAVEVPAGGAWQTVQAWLAAFRTGDEAAMRGFFETHAASGPDAPPMERRLENFRRLRRTLGNFTVSATRVTEEALEIDVRTESGERASIGFIVDRSAPYRVHGLRVQVG